MRSDKKDIQQIRKNNLIFGTTTVTTACLYYGLRLGNVIYQSTRRWLMSNITKQIYERIEHMESDAVFVASDFTDIRDINTVWQVLSRLEQKGKIVSNEERQILFRNTSQKIGIHEAIA